MNFLDSIILGVVQGITEFLPISSTGHLTLASHFLGLTRTNFQSSFEIAIQTGSMIAVAILYTRTLLSSRHLWKKVALAFLPSAVAGLILYPFIKSLLGNPLLVAISLFIGGILFLLIDRKVEQEETPARELSYREAFIVGCFQIFALIPGVSRSGATIIGGLIQKIPRGEVVRFSFLLALPTIFGATALDMVKTSFAFTSHQWLLLAVGTLISCFVSLIAMKWLLRFISTHTFRPFGIYRIIIGVVLGIIFLV